MNMFALVIVIVDGDRATPAQIFGAAPHGIKMSRLVAIGPERSETIHHNVMTMSRPPYLVVLYLALSISLSPSPPQSQVHRVFPRRVDQHAPVQHPSQPAAGRDSGISAHGPICVRPAVIRRVARLPTRRIHRQRLGARTSTTRGASSPAAGHQTLQGGWSIAFLPGQSRSSLTIVAAASARSRIVRCMTYADQADHTEHTSPDPGYDFNKRLRRAFESRSPPPILLQASLRIPENAKITDPEALKKQLELGEHIKKGESSIYIALSLWLTLTRGPRSHFAQKIPSSPPRLPSQ